MKSLLQRRCAAVCGPVLLAMLVVATGCQATIPTTPSGVLSTIHQKTLELAAERAMDQAEVSTDRLGPHKLYIKFQEVQDTDLGKQHVRRIIEDRLRTCSAGLVEDPEEAGRDITCQVLLAGVDVSQGAFFGFSWLDTKAEVQLRFQESSGGGTTEKEGTGTAKYRQLWWIGIGPSEKLK